MNSTNTQSRRPGRRKFNSTQASTKRRTGGNFRSSGGGNSRGGGSRGGRKMPTFNPAQFINKNPVETVEEIYVPKHKFSDFKLDKKIIQTVADLKLVDPSPIQDQAIPLALEGKDIIGLAATGTGKTAAFLLPLIERTWGRKTNQTLILTPTRELALQVELEFKKFSKNLHLYSTVCVGGTNINPQIRDLRRRNHFIIGTPGRILDLINRGSLRTDKIDSLVLDEADRMLDMGFIHDMREILSNVKKERQTLFFSATMTKEARGLVSEFMIDPVTISVKTKDVTDSIIQDVVKYEGKHKFDTLVTLLGKPNFKRVIIFGAMKHSVEKLSNELNQKGITAEAIHGNKNHTQRQRALNRFKHGKAQVLVATDVAARGIHVDNVTQVINYDLPGTFEDYVHRIGRTGRGIEKGEALTFVPA